MSFQGLDSCFFIYADYVLVYMLQTFGLRKKEIDSIIEKLPKDMHDVAMSSWDIAVAEGEVKGLEALKRNTRDVLRAFAVFPDWSATQVAEHTELTLSFVLKLKKVLANKKQDAALKAILPMFYKFPDMQEEDVQEISEMIEKYVPLIKF